MAILMIHLSDIHLRAADSAFVTRAKRIVDAAFSAMCNVDQVHVVVSGDIVQSGHPDEYKVATEFFQAIEFAVDERHRGMPCQFIIAPGNHDCDFRGPQAVRDRLLSGVTGAEEDGSSDLGDALGSVLAGFNSFRLERCPDLEVKSPWMSVRRDVGGSGINYIVLSSSVLSRMKEQQGTLFVPVPKAADLGDIAGPAVYVMHHPYNWLMSDNARELSQFVASTGNLFLMGHEHVSVSQKVSDLYDDAAIYYLKAHVLRDAHESLNSAFQTIEANSVDGFRIRSYVWNGTSYIESPRANVTDDFIRWEEKSLSGIALTDGAYKRLTDPGANFSHRLKASICLPDIYVWPDLRLISGEQDNGTFTPASVVSAIDVCVHEFDRLPAIVVIKGGEQFGKTALGKMAALSLCKKGVFPLLMSARKVSSWRPKALEERIDDLIRDTYGLNRRDDFKQLDVSKRCLIIDDFDLGSLTKGYSEGLRALGQYFGRIILLLDAQPGMEVPISEFLLDENLVDSRVYEMQSMSYAARLELIERWLLIGKGSVEDQEHAKVSAARLSKIVDETLGRNLIPSVPLFVVIILQRTEIETDLATVVRSGSHGFLYEALITQSITKNVNLATVGTVLTYLTEVASKLYAAGSARLSQTDYERFHVGHSDRFDLALPVRAFQGQLDAAGILESREETVEFKYPYHYYFFVARYLAGMEAWGVLEPHVDELVNSIHTERSANILLFLAHLGKNPKISEKIIERANQLLVNYDEVDLYALNSLLSKFSFTDVKQMLVDGPRAAQIEAHQDDSSSSEQVAQELNEIAAKRPEGGSAARLDEALSMNAAFKTLQVLGQVLRNHAGSTPKEKKREIANACIGLGLRVMSYLVSITERHGKEMIVFRALQLRAEKSGVTSTELAEELERYIPSLVAMNIVGAIIRIATAIGSEELKPTLDSVLAGERSRDLIRIATELEHFSRFPEAEVKKFKEDHIGPTDVLPFAVLRRFLIRRFYLFPAREELRASVCQLFGIKRVPFLPLKQKKLPATVG